MLVHPGCTHEHLRRRSGTTLADITALRWRSAETTGWHLLGEKKSDAHFACGCGKAKCWSILGVPTNTSGDALAPRWPAYQRFYGVGGNYLLVPACLGASPTLILPVARVKFYVGSPWVYPQTPPQTLSQYAGRHISAARGRAEPTPAQAPAPAPVLQ